MNKTLYQILLIFLISSCTNSSVEKNEAQYEDSNFVMDFVSGGSRVIDLPEILEESKISGKPILFYFTCYACVNARKMEEKVLNEIDIAKQIQSDFLFVPLSVDDKTKLQEDKWVKSKRTGKYLKEVGFRNSDLQIEISQSGSQPYFVIVDWEENVLGTLGYEPDEKKFMDFLKLKKIDNES